jgi:hypothetical protein
VRLEEIVLQISHTSRFAFDQNFGIERAEALYQVWVRNALQGYADIVWVARGQLNGEAIASCDSVPNVPARQLHQCTGFITSSTMLYNHKWLAHSLVGLQ